MSVTDDNNESQPPPKNAAVTPIATEIIETANPVASATISATRVPHTSCENTSWPYDVVPNRCRSDGAKPVAKLSVFGLSGAIRPGKIAATQNTNSMASPTCAFRSVRTRLKSCLVHVLLRRGLTPDDGAFAPGSGAETVLIYLPLLPFADSRVKHPGNHVHN